MRKLADTAYWIFAVGTVGSLALAVFVFLRLRPEILASSGSSIGPFDPMFLAVIAMGVTLVFGLVITMPILRQRHHEQEKLTDRAAELEVAVVTDPLTKLYNRRYFEDALDEYVSEFAKIGAPLALLTLDLDHFKSVNDTYGHDAGDVVLKQLASNLQKVTREHDIVARTGGEEFCIVAPFSDANQIRPFAERVCRMVEQMRVDIGVIILRPTISIGVASTADGPKTPKELIKISDERLYEAKEQGRNRVSC